MLVGFSPLHMMGLLNYVLRQDIPTEGVVMNDRLELVNQFGNF